MLSTTEVDTSPPEDQTISSSLFYPAISLLNFKAIIQGDEVVSDAKLVDILTRSIIDVNTELDEKGAPFGRYTYMRLEDIPADDINGTSALVIRYRAAIYGLSMARISDGHIDILSTKASRDEAEAMQKRNDGYTAQWRDNVHAILKKKSPFKVQLI